jgi:PAS domain S-box-containing protein
MKICSPSYRDQSMQASFPFSCSKRRSIIDAAIPRFVLSAGLILLAWASSITAHAHMAPEWVVENAMPASRNLSDHQAVHIDPTGQRLLTDLLKDPQAFQQLPHATPSVGFTDATVWSMVRIRSKATKAVEITTRLENARMSHLQWHLTDAQGKVLQSQCSGMADTPPRAERVPSFTWSLPAGEERLLFLQIRSDTSIWLPLWGGEREAMADREQHCLFLDALVMGFCLAIAAFMIITGLLQKSRIYSYLATVIFFYSCYFLLFNGYASLVLEQVPLWLEREFFGWIIGFALLGFSLFNARFLATRSKSKILTALRIIALAAPIVAIISVFVFSFAQSIQIINHLSLITIASCVLLVLGQFQTLKHYRWYACIWVLLVIKMLIFALQFSGYLPIVLSFRHLQLLTAPSLLFGFLIAALHRQHKENHRKQERDVEAHAFELISHISAGTYEVSLHPGPEGSVKPIFHFTSPQYLEMFDITREQLDADPYCIYQRIHPDDLPSLMAANTIAMKEPGSFRWEGRLLRDEEIRWIQAISKTRVNSEGIMVWSGLVNDITALKKAQENLRQTLENLPVAIAKDDMGAEPRVGMINEQFVKTFGYSHEEIPYVKDWAERAYPDPVYREEVMQWWFSAVKKAQAERGKIESRELIVRCKDGSDKEVIISTTMLDDGPIIAFLDITDRNRAARELESLRQTQEKYAYELTENIPAGSYAMVMQAESNGEIKMTFHFASSRMLELLHVTRDELQRDANAVFQFIHPDDLPSLFTLQKQFFHQPAPFYWQGRICHEGSVRWINIHSNPRTNRLGEIVWEGVINDITSLIETERQLQQSLASEKRLRAEAEVLSREAERAHEAKSLFLAKMSHEIRTPLSALVSLSQAMWMRAMKQPVDSDFTPFLNRVRSGSQYLNLILRNVLNISAAESGRAALKFEEFYIADWVAEIQNILEPIAEYYRGKIEWHLPADDEARWSTDQMRLTQIVLNLCENALKYSMKHQTPVRFEIGIEDSWLTLAVSDQGPGIPLEKQAVVFAAFSQLDSKISPLDEGVGIGLSVVKINTHLLQGTVTMKNQIPSGVKFCVQIPFLSPNCRAADG